MEGVLGVVLALGALKLGWRRVLGPFHSASMDPIESRLRSVQKTRLRLAPGRASLVARGRRKLRRLGS